MNRTHWLDRGRRGVYRFLPVLVCMVIFCAGYILGGTVSHQDALAQEAADGVPPHVDRHVTDNSTCMVCHMDFQFEDLSQTHEAVGVSCSQCHGFSAPHQMDEMSATPPDYLHGRKEVTGLCLACHDGAHADPDAVEVFRAQWRGKQRPSGRAVAEDSVCTDCHGNHVIAKRGGM